MYAARCNFDECTNCREHGRNFHPPIGMLLEEVRLPRNPCKGVTRYYYHTNIISKVSALAGSVYEYLDWMRIYYYFDSLSNDLFFKVLLIFS